MIPWVLGITFLTTTAAPTGMQGPCPTGRPVRLISNVVPAVGQSPMWAATGGKPIEWTGPKEPVRVLWLRDVAAKGIAFLSGKLSSKDPTAGSKVTLATSLYGTREQRLQLDHLGSKPAGIKDADLRKYAFHWTFIWFPTAGCYEITGRVGSQQSVIYLNVVPAAKKGSQGST
jgi:hypothetical protein